MDVILDLTPLHLVVEETAKSAILRMSTEGIGRGRCIGIRERESLLELAPPIDPPKDAMTKKYSFERKFSIELSTIT